MPRNPPGYGKTEINIRARGFLGSESFVQRKPAGEPPESWPGTEPEWAIKWGLEQLGLELDKDFYFQANITGIASHYFSQVDFMIPRYSIAIEVQGEFWHYGLGHERLERDEFRRIQIQGLGYTLIFVDEKDAIERPKFLAEQALMGIDHSRLGNIQRRG